MFPTIRLAPSARVLGFLLLSFTLTCSRKPTAENPMRIGVSSLRISLPVFVAIERGLFTKRGLTVDVQRFDTAQPLADELAAGRIDAGGYVAFPILFVPNAPPPRLALLTAIVEDAAHPLSYLLVKKGSGLKGTASLHGRKVGILPTLAYQKWLDAILRHDAVTDVTVVPLAPAQEVDALSSGGVDALFTGDPMATAALVRGIAEPLSATPDVPRVLGEPFLFGTFAVTRDLASSRRADVRALREALDEAIDLIAADPAVGRAAMAPYVRESERPFIDHYPPARYLHSAEVTAATLDAAFKVAGVSLRGDAFVAP